MNSRFICILAVLCFVTTLCIASPAVDHATISESVGGHLRHLSNRSLGRRQTGKRRTNNKRPSRSKEIQEMIARLADMEARLLEAHLAAVLKQLSAKHARKEFQRSSTVGGTPLSRAAISS